MNKASQESKAVRPKDSERQQYPKSNAMCQVSLMNLLAVEAPAY